MVTSVKNKDQCVIECQRLQCPHSPLKYGWSLPHISLVQHRLLLLSSLFSMEQWRCHQELESQDSSHQSLLLPWFITYKDEYQILLTIFLNCCTWNMYKVYNCMESQIEINIFTLYELCVFSLMTAADKWISSANKIKYYNLCVHCPAVRFLHMSTVMVS